MFDSFEGANGFLNFVQPSSGETCGGHGSKNVFKIVCAGKRDFRLLEDNFLFAVMAENDFFPGEKSSLRDALLAAEPKNFWFCGRVRRARGIVGIQHSKIGGGLLFEDARFGGAVGFHGTVAVEMIGREIQENADVWAERLNPFKLKAAEFGDGYSLIVRLLGDINQRRADIAGQ